MQWASTTEGAGVGYEVDPEALRRSASAAREVADVLERLNFGPLSDTASGMPGSTAGQKSGHVGQHLSKDAKAKAKNMNTHAEELDAAADRYESDDEQTRQGFN